MACDTQATHIRFNRSRASTKTAQTHPMKTPAVGTDHTFPDQAAPPRRWLLLMPLIPTHQTILIHQLAVAGLQPEYAAIAGRLLGRVPEIAIDPAVKAVPSVAVKQLVSGLFGQANQKDTLTAAGAALTELISRSDSDIRAQLQRELRRSSASAWHRRAVLQRRPIWSGVLEGPPAP